MLLFGLEIVILGASIFFIKHLICDKFEIPREPLDENPPRYQETQYDPPPLYS